MVNYDAFAQTFSNSRKQMQWQEIDAIIEDIEQRNAFSILDIGCGNGRFLEILHRKNPARTENYIGIDSSSGMIQEARKLHPKHDFFVGDMTDIGSVLSLNRTFDTIVLIASFHHLSTRETRIQVLFDLKKYLTPDGTIYMTNWNLNDQKKYESARKSQNDYDIKIGVHSRYYHGFTQEELHFLFTETGWHVEENRIFDGGKNIYSKLSLPYTP